jgi:hypothetical protein
MIDICSLCSSRSEQPDEPKADEDRELGRLVSILEYHLIKYRAGRTSLSSPYASPSSVNNLSPRALPFSSSP